MRKTQLQIPNTEIESFRIKLIFLAISRLVLCLNPLMPEKTLYTCKPISKKVGKILLRLRPNICDGSFTRRFYLYATLFAAINDVWFSRGIPFCWPGVYSLHVCDRAVECPYEIQLLDNTDIVRRLKRTKPFELV